MSQETAIARIHSVVSATRQIKRTVLFGSRARGDAANSSDFDLLLIVADELPRTRRVKLATELPAKLARLGIDADLVVKDESQVDEMRDKLGSIVHNALIEGIPV